MTEIQLFGLCKKGIYWKIVKYFIALMKRLEDLVQKTDFVKRPGITAKVIPPEESCMLSDTVTI